MARSDLIYSLIGIVAVSSIFGYFRARMDTSGWQGIPRYDLTPVHYILPSDRTPGKLLIPAGGYEGETDIGRGKGGVMLGLQCDSATQSSAYLMATDKHHELLTTDQASAKKPITARWRIRDAEWKPLKAGPATVGDERHTRTVRISQDGWPNVLVMNTSPIQIELQGSKTFTFDFVGDGVEGALIEKLNRCQGVKP